MSKQRTEVLYLRVTPELRDQLVKLANVAGVTISDAATEVLSKGLGLHSPNSRLIELLRDTPETP